MERTHTYHSVCSSAADIREKLLIQLVMIERVSASESTRIVDSCYVPGKRGFALPTATCGWFASGGCPPLRNRSVMLSLERLLHLHIRGRRGLECRRPATDARFGPTSNGPTAVDRTVGGALTET